MKILKEDIILNNSNQIESVVDKLAKEFIKWYGQDLSDYDNIDEFIGSKEFRLIEILQDEYGYEPSCLSPSDIENTINFAMGNKETNRFYQFNPQFVEMIQDKIAELLNNELNESTGTFEEYKGYIIRHSKEKDFYIYKDGKEIASGISTDKEAEEFIDRLNESLKEDINNSIDSNIILSVGDMLEGSIGNMSEDDINRDISLYNKIGKILKINNINDIICIVDTDDRFNPEYNKNTSLEYSKKYIDVYSYQLNDSFNDMLICVNKLNGINYIFFASEEDAELYIEDTKEMENDYGFEEDDSFNY